MRTRVATFNRNSDIPFANAVRHMFRNLHDVTKLRRNPITARFFDDPRIGGYGAARDRAVLALIHKAVLDAAVDCRESDLKVGRKSAFRQHAIILDQCLGREDIKAVAERLGISTNSCYRARASICNRVAMHLARHSSLPALDFTFQLDHFRLRVDRAIRAVLNGEATSAFHDCEGLLKAVDLVEQKVEALCLDVSVSLHFGKIGRAQQKLREAQQLVATECSVESTLSCVPLARIDLSGCLLAHRMNQSVRAATLAGSARHRLLPIVSNAPASTKELLTSSLNELAAALWNLGDHDRAYEIFSEAAARLSPAGCSSLLGAIIMVQLWRVRNRLVMQSASWFPLLRRIEGLQEAFQEAYRFGAIPQAVEALEGLVEVYAFAGNDTEALRNGRLAISMVDELGSELFKARTMLSIAGRLMHTSHASYGLLLLASAEALTVPDAVCRSRLSCLRAERALQSHQSSTAWRLATGQSQQREPMEITLRKRIVAAVSLYQLGRQTDALHQVESLIVDAERFASAPILLDTYHAARLITRDRVFGTKAKEIKNLLTA